MAPFWVLVTLMMALMASVLCSSVPISAAPAVLPDPSTEISPDIAPLLPSPGGELPAPSASDIPTIPSNPSPNPDQIASLGPDFALSPNGAELVSAAVYGHVSWYLNLGSFVGVMVFWYTWFWIGVILGVIGFVYCYWSISVL